MRQKCIPVETQQILTTISRFLKEYRFQNGLSQTQLSEMSGIHANTISHIESWHSKDSRHTYNIVSLIEICMALDLPLRELFWEL